MGRGLESIIARSILYLALISLIVFLYGFSGSIRYSGGDAVRAKIQTMYYEGDIEGLNQFLRESRALSELLVTMAYLADFQDDSSIPVLVEKLSFDLPWFDRLWEDSFEDKVTSGDVRWGAHISLAKYDYDRAGKYIVPLIDSRDSFAQLYAAAILVRWGDPRGQEVLEELIHTSSARIRDEAEWALKKALDAAEKDQ